MEVKTVGVACDHAGYPLKKFVLEYLEEKGYPYKDYGTWSDASVDYSDFGHALAEGIESGEVYPGIAICGSGEGISMTLNKHQQVRAGLCWIPEIAHLIRQHNDANVLVMPGRTCDAWSFHRQQHGAQDHGRVLHCHLRRRSPSETCRQNPLQVIFGTDYTAFIKDTASYPCRKPCP